MKAEPRALQHPGRADTKPRTAIAKGSQPLDSLHMQLRLQSVDIDRLEAENAEQQALVRTLQKELTHLHTTHESDAQDLVHLAGVLLALSRAAGVDLELKTKELFRRRGWSSSAHRGQQP